MKPRRIAHANVVIIFVVAGALAAAALLAASTRAALSGEVIVASDTTLGKRAVMSAVDGSGLTAVDCGGDLTQGGQPRYFVHAQATGGTYPDGRPVAELFSYGEDCDSPTQLTSDPMLERVEARWSPNGLRIAFGGTRFDMAGQVVERGIFVGDVTLGLDGRPLAITNERLAVALAIEQVIPSWAGDSVRVAYALNLGTPAAPQYDLFVADVDTHAVTNVTGSPTVSEFQPAFSPVANRLAFVRQTSKGGVFRNDVFVLDLSTGRIGQVTSKATANAAQIGHPSWSPDGADIAFSGWSVSGGKSDVYRIPADGRTKARNLTGSFPDNYAAPLWRR